MYDKRERRRRRGLGLLLLLALVLAVGLWVIFGPQPYYSAAELGIPELLSGRDADGDGLDDSLDMVTGAREYIAERPVYKSLYYQGGYPTDEHGVCTDVIWRAFRAAGYELKDLVDADIAAASAAYGITEPDPNIDFRRVVNLKVFFERHGQSLTLDLDEVAEWQPGDIVVFPRHIGLCSDRRNSRGVPFLIHHGNRVVGAEEEDRLGQREIIGHFRFVPF